MSEVMRSNGGLFSFSASVVFAHAIVAFSIATSVAGLAAHR